MTILIAILVFSVLIFIHELGHFIAAKRCGIAVVEFALGMGPRLISFTRGETIYALRLFPVGGFCAMEGDDEESASEGAFCNASLWKRILVMLAGSMMNLLLGVIILGYLTTQMSVIPTTQIASFREDAISNQRLMVGDVITRVNGHGVGSGNDLFYEFMRSRDGVLDMEVIRNNERILLEDVVFRMEQLEDSNANFLYFDFYVGGKEKTVANVIGNTFNWTKFEVKSIVGSLVDMVTGRYGFNDLSGPVGVTTAIGEASSRGWRDMLDFISFITVNLAVFNLLPLPALDGGRLLFLVVEGIRRKPIPARYEGWIHAVGFILLIGLMVVVTVSDIIKLL